jgi:hypothetical protein
MGTGQEERFLGHEDVLTVNAGEKKKKVETGITVFTRMQDEVFLLNLSFKYERSF